MFTPSFVSYISKHYHHHHRVKDRVKGGVHRAVRRVLAKEVYILSHEYLFLIDFILYLCRSGWFHITLEMDFIIHMF
jgi:hypothetical protein